MRAPFTSPRKRGEGVTASTIPVELAFLGDALVRLAVALDAVEKLVPFRRQQFDDLKASAGLGSAERPRGVLDRLSDRVLVTRHSRSPFRKNVRDPGGTPTARGSRHLSCISIL